MIGDKSRFVADASSKTIQSMFAETKYNIDYYQREYKWTEKEVTELLDDLLIRFLDKHNDNNSLPATEHYSPYFLGSYVVSETYKDGTRYNNLIDGQQRLTTIMLIFLYLSSRLKELGEDYDTSISKVRSNEYGVEKFTVVSAEREAVLNKLYNYAYNKEKEDASLKSSNLYVQYGTIKEYLDERLSGIGTKFFQHWLSKKVTLIEIKTNSDSDAYTIFESMNDRGQPLTKTDLFKGFVLSSVPEPRRPRSEQLWKDIVKNTEESGTSLDLFIRDVLRSRYALSAPRKAKDLSIRNDWFEIGAAPHRWLRENADSSEVKIASGEDYYKLLEELEYYSRLQKDIVSYTNSMTPGYERVAYICNKKPLFPSMLFFAGITKEDQEKGEKIKLIAEFLDIRASQQTWQNLDYTTENYADAWVSSMSRKMRKITDIDTLAAVLYQNLESSKVFDEQTPTLYKRKTGIRKKQLFWMLSHIAAEIEVAVAKANPWMELATQKYEIEHLLAANYEANSGLYSNQIELDLVRDEIGALIILEKSANASLSDMSYEKKLKEYPKHGLAELLSPGSYDINGNLRRRPRLNSFFEQNGDVKKYLKPHTKMTKDDISVRSNLYRELAKVFWSRDNLYKYTSCDTLEDFVEVYVELSKIDADHEDEIETEEITESHYEEITIGTADGIMGTATVEVSSNYEFFLIELKSARLKKLYKKTALNGFNANVFRQKLYRTIMKDATIDPDNSLFDWSGRVSINSRNAALEMLVGYGGGQISRWTRIEKPSEELNL